MISLVKYCGFILILNVIGLFSYQICNNWCPSPGYGRCCDYYSGQGYYPSYPAIGGQGPILGGTTIGSSIVGGQPGSCPVIPGCTLVPTLYCPVLNCSTPPTSLRDCTDDDDCTRKEKCCKNPCDEGKRVCLTGISQQEIIRGCPTIDNCRKWNEENQSPVTCTTTDDCKRSETCCSTPCNIQMVCQKTETSSTSTSTNKLLCVIGLPGCY